MDRNTITGIALIIVIFVFFSWWNAPTEEEKAKMLHERDSIAQVIKEQRATDSLRNVVQAKLTSLKTDNVESSKVYSEEVTAIDEQSIKDKFGVFANSSVGEEKLITVESDVLKLKFSNKGARIYSAELKNFQTNDSMPLILFQGDTARFGFVFNAANRLINTQDHYYKVFINVTNLTIFLK